MWRQLLMVWLLLAWSACGIAEALPQRIWSSERAGPVSIDEVVDQLALSRFILLGETHDNEIHHQRQSLLLDALQRRLKKAVLAMEIFDRGDQTWLDARPTLEEIGQRVTDRGWDWALYRPLVERADRWGWPLQALNLSRDEAMSFARGQATLPAETVAKLSDSARAGLLQQLIDGHCNQLSDDSADRLLHAQQARDAAMAEALQRAWQRWHMPVVMVAGSAHVRRDQGVPVYMTQAGYREGAGMVTLAMVEARAASNETNEGDRHSGRWDFVWSAPAQERPDPCALFNRAPQAAAAVSQRRALGDGRG